MAIPVQDASPQPQQEIRAGEHHPLPKDPLIAGGWEHVLQVLSISIFVGITIMIGLISQQAEYAIFFAFLASATIMVVLMFTI